MLTVDLSTQNNMSLVEYPKVIPYTKFEHFGIIRFWVMFQTNKQTNKQTDSKILRTPTDVTRWAINTAIIFLCTISQGLQEAWIWNFGIIMQRTWYNVDDLSFLLEKSWVNEDKNLKR